LGLGLDPLFIAVTARFGYLLRPKYSVIDVPNKDFIPNGCYRYKDKNCHKNMSQKICNVTVVAIKNIIVEVAGTKKKKKCGRRATSWAASRVVRCAVTLGGGRAGWACMGHDVAVNENNVHANVCISLFSTALFIRNLLDVLKRHIYDVVDIRR
jgi:hypothetical protein